ncbi:uncharacterized protein [Halyomorpha halys]|uniref:uncharacterized protein isoform X2 n=1 Tax=Halyomorpha halys TaxID=286706 RepID=UPI0006D51852|nr:uncharacterized protein LOC106686505 isoform X2 [Halyomorpha halys]
MSSRELECSLKNLKMSVGESHETQPDESSLTSGVLKEKHDGPNFIDDADKAYIILLNVFQYLSTKDLLSAAQVCKVWNLVGSDNRFKKKINLNNCLVNDSNLIVQILKKYGTEKLDLRGVSFFKVQRGTARHELNFRILHYLCFRDYWFRFCKLLTQVTTLTEVIMEECPPEAVTLLAEGLPQLKSLSAYSISEGNARIQKYIGDFLNVNFLKNMKDLLTLRLESIGSKTLIFCRSNADNIELNLMTLTITRAINLSCIEHILPSTLVSLTLGDCHSLSSCFCKVVLPNLVNLKRLRLETCHNPNITIMLVEQVSELPSLSELELVDFEFSIEFPNVLAKCTNIKSLLIMPRIGTFRPLLIGNKVILTGVSKLKYSLQVFVWAGTDPVISTENQSKLEIGPNQPNVMVFGHGDKIAYYIQNGATKVKMFTSFDKIQSKLWPDLKFKIVLADSSSKWKLSLQNIRI